MKIRAIAILLLILAPFSLFAVSQASSYEASPFHAPSYHGKFDDMVANPAALALIKDDSSFIITLLGYEIYDKNVFTQPLGFIQDNLLDVGLSFFSRNMALSIDLGTSFTDRSYNMGDKYPSFNIYSAVDISLDIAYAFPYVAFGMNISGGNSLIRASREVTSIANAIAHAYMSPFESVAGSERFNLGIGILAYFNNFAFGVEVDKVVALEDGQISANWELFLSSMEVSISGNGNQFSKDGELNLFNPRVSLTYRGFNQGLDTDYFALKGDLMLQLLPKASIALGVVYSEFDHKMFRWDINKGNIGIFLSGIYREFTLTLGVDFEVATLNDISPSIQFSFVT